MSFDPWYENIYMLVTTVISGTSLLTFTGLCDFSLSVYNGLASDTENKLFLPIHINMLFLFCSFTKQILKIYYKSNMCDAKQW